MYSALSFGLGCVTALYKSSYYYYYYYYYYYKLKIFVFTYNLTHCRMFTSKVWTDDSRLLQELNLASRQPHRAPHHVIQATTSEGLAQGPYVSALWPCGQKAPNLPLSRRAPKHHSGYFIKPQDKKPQRMTYPHSTEIEKLPLMVKCNSNKVDPKLNVDRA